MRLVAHVDGGVGSVEAYIGVVLTDADSGEILLEHGAGIGKGTNNEAEYSALLFALYQAIEWEAESLSVFSDSRLIVNQVNGAWAIHENHLRDYAVEARRLIQQLPAFTLEWVRRTENTVADGLTRAPRPV